MTIKKEELVSGIIVRAESPRGNMHKEFSLWKRGVLWMRFRSDFGEIVGLKHTNELLAYLNRYNFQIIGRWERRLYAEPKIKDTFKISGAL